MNAGDYLSQYLELNSDINADLEEIARLRALAAKVSPSERLSDGGNISDRVGRTVAKIVDLENRINEEIDRFVDLRGEIAALINRVPNVKQRQVLRYKYINGWTEERIAEEMNITDRWVRELHKKALKNFEEFLLIPEKM